jgi:3alpha(or 20beta)-hydroxysteroid dehydrogenase
VLVVNPHRYFSLSWGDEAAKHGSSNISSVEGLRGSRLHGYVACQVRVRGLTKSVAVELGRHNVRVNSVHPGFIVTPDDRATRLRGPAGALGRPKQPEEVSSLIVSSSPVRSRPI